MRWNLYIKEHHAGGDFIWKFLCVVLDHEALGLLERMLVAAGFEIKTVKEEVNHWPALANSPVRNCGHGPG